MTDQPGYFEQSRRPLTSLALVAPLLVVYEAGVVILGGDAVRNGADVWLRQILDLAGFGQYLLLPVLTVWALLAWHHTTGERWRVSPGVVVTMLLETLLLAFVLVVLAQLLGRVFPDVHPSATTADVQGRVDPAMFGLFLGYLGAGIYEEVLFRLLLIPLTMAVIGALGGSPRVKTAGAVLVTALLFSAAHYVGQGGYPLQWFSFSFRFLAGVFFAGLFLWRGFGIAAGTHAGYDIFVGLLRL